MNVVTGDKAWLVRRYKLERQAQSWMKDSFVTLANFEAKQKQTKPVLFDRNRIVHHEVAPKQAVNHCYYIDVLKRSLDIVLTYLQSSRSDWQVNRDSLPAQFLGLFSDFRLNTRFQSFYSCHIFQ